MGFLEMPKVHENISFCKRGNVSAFVYRCYILNISIVFTSLFGIVITEILNLQL